MIRYLAIVAWARARYTKNGSLIVSIGGAPSIYSRIENLAFKKYMMPDRDSNGCLLFASKF